MEKCVAKFMRHDNQKQRAVHRYVRIYKDPALSLYEFVIPQDVTQRDNGDPDPGGLCNRNWVPRPSQPDIISD